MRGKWWLVLIGLVLVLAVVRTTPHNRGEDKYSPKDFEDFELILPVKKEDVVFKLLGIWPFGVRGGDHPHGHPGIDIEANQGTPIYAAVNGTVSNISDSTYEGTKTFSLMYATESEIYEIYYTGSMKGFKISSRAEVNQGDLLAYFDLWPDGKGGKLEVGYIHFEVHQRNTDQSVCPVDFMTKEARGELEELHRRSTYQEKAEFPLLCNPCPEGGCY